MKARIILFLFCALLVRATFSMQKRQPNEGVAITFYLRVVDFFSPEYAGYRKDITEELHEMQAQIPEHLRAHTDYVLQTIQQQNNPQHSIVSIGRNMIPGISQFAPFLRHPYYMQFAHLIALLPEATRQELNDEMIQELEKLRPSATR